MRKKKEHADILDSPKAKRIVSKCGKCSFRCSGPQLMCREVQRVTGVEGVLLEGKHWVVREVPPPSPHLTSPHCSPVKVNQLSQDVSLCRLFSFLKGTC